MVRHDDACWRRPLATDGTAVPGERFELPTNGLQNRCSTTELTRQGVGTIEPFQSRTEQNRLTATALLPFISWAGSVKRAAGHRQHERRHLPVCREGRGCIGPR